MKKDKEVWKLIEGYEDYKISNHGNVIHLARFVRSKGISKPFFKSEKRLKHQLDGKKYLKVALHKNGIPKDFRIHRLVASAFVPNPNNYPVVMHLDDDRKNPFYKNLMWGTGKLNAIAAVKTGRVKTGEKAATAKISNETVIKIRELFKTGGITQREIANISGVPYKRVNVIVNNKQWKHL